jgi:YbgC/YbaW family acyl-CoA thioester hydrolase
MEKIVASYARIRFQDCDPFNHLNNSKYIDYFINAREDHVREEYGLDIFSMLREHGVSWLVSSHQIQFLRPAALMEKVLIESQLIGFTAKSLHVEMCMWDEGRTKLKSILWTQFIHIDLKTQRPVDHSASLMQLFEGILQTVPATSMTERIATIS